MTFTIPITDPWDWYIKVMIIHAEYWNEPMLLESNIAGGGFKYVLMFYFYPYLGKIPNLTNIVHMG